MKISKLMLILCLAVVLAITPAAALSLNGSGDDVKSFSANGTSLRVFSIQYTGEANFIVWLKDGQGNNLDLLVNTIGSYSGNTSAQLQTGNYFLDISASGPWTIDIVPNVSEIPLPSDSPITISGTGDDVKSFSADGTNLRIFSMQYTGEANFIVWLKDGQGNNLDLLANKIGSYSGNTSAQLQTGEYFLDIAASGPWTIDIVPNVSVEPPWIINATAGTGGAISPNGSVQVEDGGSQAFTITPDNGYIIVNVEVDGIQKGAISSYEFTDVHEDHNISASFLLVPPLEIQVTEGSGCGRISLGQPFRYCNSK